MNKLYNISDPIISRVVINNEEPMRSEIVCVGV